MARAISQNAWLRRLGWALWILVIGLVASAAGLLSRTYHLPVQLSWGFRGSILPLPLTFSTVGLLITSRLPRHRIGWLFHATGLGFGVQTLAEEYAIYALIAHPGALPAGEFAAWIDNWIWITSFSPALLALLLFPDGRLLSRRWRLAAGILALGAAGLTLQYTLKSGPMQSSFPIDNPYTLIRGFG